MKTGPASEQPSAGRASLAVFPRGINGAAESAADRAKRLAAEAAAAAQAHVEELIAAVNEAERLMAETVDVPGVPVGIRDLCRIEAPKVANLVLNLSSMGSRK